MYNFKDWCILFDSDLGKNRKIGFSNNQQTKSMHAA